MACTCIIFILTNSKAFLYDLCTREFIISLNMKTGGVSSEDLMLLL